MERKKAADKKAAEAAKKAEAEGLVKKLLAEGVSADEILAKLLHMDFCGHRYIVYDQNKAKRYKGT
ncbi:hypothetical protein [Novisyntrophococcus fermenticellae]|uniref:hypothetical protein n=1 Tax=Novisyntrophococcus fermenticellae TaxID=2068655 RepID=UPI001E39D09E|nr:hypothetical protein [Novisyntrophococcus fermenticellae]